MIHVATLPGAPCRDQVSRVLMSKQIQHRRHTKGFSFPPLGCRGRDLCVGGTEEKDAEEVPYYLSMGNFWMKEKKSKVYVAFCILGFLFI